MDLRNPFGLGQAGTLLGRHQGHAGIRDDVLAIDGADEATLNQRLNLLRRRGIGRDSEQASLLFWRSRYFLPFGCDLPAFDKAIATA